jgi:hypothetical protein
MAPGTASTDIDFFSAVLPATLSLEPRRADRARGAASSSLNQPFGLFGDLATGGIVGSVGADKRTGVQCQTARGLPVAALRCS